MNGGPFEDMLSLKFPIARKEVEKVTHIGPWLASILETAPKQVLTQYTAHWPKVTSKNSNKLCKMIEDSAPESLVIFERKAWVHVKSAISGGSQTKTVHLYLPEPKDPNQIARHLKSLGIGGVADVVEFFTLFSGLRDFPPCLAGNFQNPSEMESITRLFMGGANAHGVPPEWKNSVSIYHGTNGDRVLLHPSGRTGWHRMGPIDIPPIADTFEEFISIYLKNLRSNTTFESYSFIR